MRFKPITRLFFVLGAVAAMSFVLVSCDTTDDEMVTENPPPVLGQPEIIPVIQYPQSEIWRPGYWTLGGDGFVWVAGKVIPRPSNTAAWTPARWVQHTYGWTFEQGHWE
jgi:hypothetical protein